MDLTRSLLNIPSSLFFCILIIFFSGSNLVIKHLVIKFYRKINIPKGFIDVSVSHFVVVSGFYALLLAFVISESLSSFNDAQRDVTNEGSHALNLYRQINSYPDSAMVPKLKLEYLNYVKMVVEDEFPKMTLNQKSELTQKSFIKVFEIVEQLKPSDQDTRYKANMLMQGMNELSIERNLRESDGDTEIPYDMYFALFAGWLITSLLSALINIENKSYDSFVICLSGAFIGLVFFLIISLDHPFAGSIRIEPSAYNDLLKYIINQ